ncbi:MAG: hypothetical protein ABW022_14840 [Actinoplanes sp.]
MTTTTTPDAGGSLTKLTANMNERSMTALAAAAETTGFSRTDCLNRAIQLYAYIEKLRRDGGRLLVQNPEGKTQTLDIL